MLKFRSMVVDAEAKLAQMQEDNEGAGLLFKMVNDPRVTRCGHWMRKFSLDELPQFWNVVRGHMSLVGPRPPLAREVAKYQQPVQRRLLIKPGITGLWQINGRSDLAWDEAVRLDLYYVENWSLTGDIIILWRTFRAVSSPSGAY
ncbi:sugar transferase [Arthrobacter psychrolactophilus]